MSNLIFIRLGNSRPGSIPGGARHHFSDFCSWRKVRKSYNVLSSVKRSAATHLDPSFVFRLQVQGISFHITLTVEKAMLPLVL